MPLIIPETLPAYDAFEENVFCHAPGRHWHSTSARWRS